MATDKQRIEALEQVAHKPYDFSELIKRIEIIESILCDCENAIDSCPIHGLGPIGREDRGA